MLSSPFFFFVKHVVCTVSVYPFLYCHVKLSKRVKLYVFYARAVVLLIK